MALPPPTIAVELLHPAAQLPRYAHAGPFGDLAADLHAIAHSTLEPGATAAIPTGLALALPAGVGALIAGRSGMALRGLHTLAGVVDPGFRGEIKVILHNLSATPQVIRPGDRIAQLRIVPLLQASFVLAETPVAETSATERHTRGFGSTGA